MDLHAGQVMESHAERIDHTRKAPTHHDWETKAAALTHNMVRDLSPNADLEVDPDFESINDYPTQMSQPEQSGAEDLEAYIGVFRTYDLRQGINRQPEMEYYDLDESGTYRRHQSSESESDEESRRRKRAVKSRSTKNSQQRRKSTKSSQDNRASDDDAETQAQMGKSVIVEKTSGLSHPVRFFGPPKSCHWCRDVAYGLLAPSRTSIAKYRMTDVTTSLQWFPASHRTSEHYKDGSCMCNGHASSRLRVAFCPCHHMTTIHVAGEIKKSTPQEKIERSVKAIQRLRHHCIRPTDRFCDVCLNLATYHCDGNAKLPAKVTDKVTQQQVSGCGLHLCDTCIAVMQARSQRIHAPAYDLQKHLEWLLSTKDNSLYRFGPRPDAELLLNDGLLVRNFKQFARQSLLPK